MYVHHRQQTENRIISLEFIINDYIIRVSINFKLYNEQWLSSNEPVEKHILTKWFSPSINAWKLKYYRIRGDKVYF